MSHEPDKSERRSTAGRRLTDRQAAILDLVAAGLENKEIAHRLGISEQAVKEHVSALLRILSAPNRAALADTAATRRFAGVDLPAEWLEVLFRRAPMYVALIGRDHRYVAANDTVVRLVGRDPVGLDVRELFAAMTPSGIFEDLDAVFATGERRELHELAGRWDRDGDGEPEDGYITVFLEPILAAGEVDGVAVFALDVTDVVQAHGRP